MMQKRNTNGMPLVFLVTHVEASLCLLPDFDALSFVPEQLIALLHFKRIVEGVDVHHGTVGTELRGRMGNCDGGRLGFWFSV